MRGFNADMRQKDFFEIGSNIKPENIRFGFDRFAQSGYKNQLAFCAYPAGPCAPTLHLRSRTLQMLFKTPSPDRSYHAQPHAEKGN